MHKLTNMTNLCFCRMPDPDFSVNDVKMFVGKVKLQIIVIIGWMLQYSVSVSSCVHLFQIKFHLWDLELTLVFFVLRTS